MITYTICYIVGHLAGAVCDRNRHAIMSFVSAKWRKAMIALEAKFK